MSGLNCEDYFLRAPQGMIELRTTTGLPEDYWLGPEPRTFSAASCAGSGIVRIRRRLATKAFTLWQAPEAGPTISSQTGDWSDCVCNAATSTLRAGQHIHRRWLV